MPTAKRGTTEVLYHSRDNRVVIRKFKRGGAVDGHVALTRKEAAELVDQLLQVGVVTMVPKPNR